MNRILFVTESLFRLGPAEQLAMLANGLVERGVQVKIALLASEDRDRASVGRGGEPERKGWLDSRIGIQYLQQGPAIRGTIRGGIQSTLALRQLAHSWKPNVIHHWCGNSDWIVQAAVPFKKNSLARPRLFRTELGLQPTKRFSHWLFENKIAPPFEITVVGHELVRQRIIDQQEETQEAERIELVPNRLSVDAPSGRSEAGGGTSFDPSHPSSFRQEPQPPKNLAAPSPRFALPNREPDRKELRSKLNLPPDTKLAGSVAPLIPRTRLKDLIWATDLLTCVRDDFHFLILGRGAQQARLRRFAGLTEAAEHVHFLDEPEDGLSILAGLDVYWHSHLQHPLCPNLMTAMSLGVPAISVFGAGTEELIRHQQTGFAVNFGARDEFARWTKYILELPAAAEQLARQGQEFVQDKFTGSLVDDYWRLYNE